MKRVFAAVFVTATVLVLSAVIATQLDTVKASEVLTTQETQASPSASAGDSSGTGGTGLAPLRSVQAQVETEKQSYVGIQITSLPEGEAEELGVAGGVLVVSVVEGGPSEGVLDSGDVIVSIDGQGVGNPDEVGEIVKAAEPGDVLAFTVVRDGGPVNVDVTVGERVVTMVKEHRIFNGMQDDILGGLKVLSDSFVRAEVVMQTDEGFKTIKAVAGTASEIDVDAGTFIVTPADESGPVAFQITDETKVHIGHVGDLSGLNTEDRTIVLEVDGQVEWVLQGDMSPAGLPGPSLHGFLPPDFMGRLDELPMLRDMPQLRERIREFIPAMPHDGFKMPDCGSLDLPDNLRDRFGSFFCQSSDSDEDDDPLVQ